MGLLVKGDIMALFYSVGEMADILGITERSVYRSKSKIPGYVKIAGRCYFNRQVFHRETQGQEPEKEKGLFVDDKHFLLQ